MRVYLKGCLADISLMDIVDAKYLCNMLEEKNACSIKTFSIFLVATVNLPIGYRFK